MYKLFLILVLLPSFVFADTTIVGARVQSLTNSAEYAVAHFTDGRIEIDPYYFESESSPVVEAIFSGHEKDYVLEVKIDSLLKHEIVLEQRTQTSAYLSNEGPTKFTSVANYSEWERMEWVQGGQYLFNKIQMVYSDDVIERILADYELEDNWKNLVRPCLKDKAEDCYYMGFLESIEVRVMQQEGDEIKELGKITINKAFGC